MAICQLLTSLEQFISKDTSESSNELMLIYYDAIKRSNMLERNPLKALIFPFVSRRALRVQMSMFR